MNEKPKWIPDIDKATYQQPRARFIDEEEEEEEVGIKNHKKQPSNQSIKSVSDVSSMKNEMKQQNIHM